MMKKILLASAAASAMSFMPLAAHAYDGTVSITGSLSGASCTIKVNNGDKDGTVQLPSVGAASLASKGAVTGATNFTIALSNCTNAGKSVRAFFEAGPNVNGVDGTLYNRALTNAATNVAVQLLDLDRKALMAGDVSQRNGRPVDLVGNAATMIYSAQYYSLGAATAGSVSTSVTYSIDYL
ncbi:fimbrial protein [Burkholderia sp. MR1-5-21]